VGVCGGVELGHADIAAGGTSSHTVRSGDCGRAQLCAGVQDPPLAQGVASRAWLAQLRRASPALWRRLQGACVSSAEGRWRRDSGHVRTVFSDWCPTTCSAFQTTPRSSISSPSTTNDCCTRQLTVADCTRYRATRPSRTRDTAATMHRAIDSRSRRRIPARPLWSSRGASP